MKRNLFFLLLSIILIFPCDAQNLQNIDSLKNLLKSIEEKKPPFSSDTIKANIFYLISKEYWSGDLDKSMEYAKQVLSLSQAIHYKKGEGNAYNSIGVIYWYKGEYSQALEYNERALKIREETGNKDDIARSYNNIGLIYDDRGNFPEALAYYLKSLKLHEETEEKEGIAQAHNNIGVIYSNQRNFTEALKNYEAALKIRLQEGDKWGLTESYSNIGVVNIETGNYDEAYSNYILALKLREEIGDSAGIAISYNNLGDYYQLKGNYAEALKAMQHSLKINEEIGYKKSIADVELNMACLYEKQGKMEMALNYELRAVGVAKEIGAVDYLNNIYKVLSQTCAKMENYKDAYKYQVLFKQTNDSLFNSDKDKSLTRLQLQYDFDKRHLADSLQFAQEKQVSYLKLQRQRILSWGGIAGLCVVIVLLFYALRNFKKQKVANKNLRETQQQLIRQEKLASLGQMTAGIAHEIQNPLNFVNNFSEVSSDLVDEFVNAKADFERKEIASDLKNNLNKISYHGKRADNIVKGMLLHSRSGRGEQQLTDINTLCDEAIGLAYHSMRAKDPAFNCKIEKSFDENLPQVKIIPQDISRVLLNLLNNAFYALKEKTVKQETDDESESFPQVHIITSSTDNSLIIKIRDNGNGIHTSIKEKIFEPFYTTKPTGEGTGLGLSLSYDVIKAHGGEISFESSEGNGSEFKIILPINES